MRHIPEDLQRHMASFVSEGGSAEANKGDVLFGSGRRQIADEQSRCVCGICFSSGSPGAASCTLLSDGNERVVRRISTDICMPVCLSRDPLRMLLKLIRTLLFTINEMADDGCSLLRILFQTDEQLMRGSEYVFDARFESEPRRLEIDIMRELRYESSARDVDLTYAPGADIDETHVKRSARVKKALRRYLIEQNGHECSLLFCCEELPRREGFSVGSIPFVSVGGSCFRSQPLFLFVHARPAGA